MIDCPIFMAREDILRRWETQSRARFPSASCKATEELRDHVPQILLSLCEALRGHEAPNLRRLSRVHGRQRFSFGDYTLAQVIGEYDLLKEIAFEYADGPDPRRTIALMKVIGAFFDEAAKTAAAEFADLRQEELRSTMAKVEISRAELEYFASVVAHDMRSPLATIASFCELLSLDADSTMRTQLVGTIAATAHRTMSLIDRLLEYSKLGHRTLHEERVDLDEVFRSTTTNLRAALAQAKATITSEPLGETSGDPYLIGQLFQNLLSNSLKFAKADEPCEIKVTVQETPDRLKRICVIDNGIGIPAEKRQEIFEPFRRAHAQKEYIGAGLGLAICQKVVDLHGGTIEASGVEGKGSTIAFTLPAPSRCEEMRHA